MMKQLVKISLILFFLVSITNKVFAENVSELFSNLIPGEGLTEASIQINEDDLIIALSTNVIAGAGLDVYEKEPLPSGHKLRFIPNVLLLPHLGYVTAENYSIFYTQMFENLESCVSGKPIRVIK